MGVALYALRSSRGVAVARVWVLAGQKTEGLMSSNNEERVMVYGGRSSSGGSGSGSGRAVR